MAIKPKFLRRKTDYHSNRAQRRFFVAERWFWAGDRWTRALDSYGVIEAGSIGDALQLVAQDAQVRADISHCHRSAVVVFDAESGLGGGDHRAVGQRLEHALRRARLGEQGGAFPRWRAMGGAMASGEPIVAVATEG